jgi:hypothetical protein
MAALLTFTSSRFFPCEFAFLVKVVGTDHFCRWLLRTDIIVLEKVRVLKPQLMS